MFKAIHGKAPDYITNIITMLCDILPYNNRNTVSMNLHVPHFNTAAYEKSLTISGANLWNSLPNSIKNCTTINAFKNAYRKHYFK